MKKKIIVFGVGQNYKNSEDRIKNIYDVVALVDNNISEIDGEEVYKPEKIFMFEFDGILVTPSDYDSIVAQLRGMNVPESKIYIRSFDDRFFRKSSVGIESFSQHFDDLIIASIFGMMNIDKPSYIDAGANHAFLCSNTALLYLHGSRGVLIEANPSLIFDLRQSRPEDICINIGLGADEGVLPFYILDESGGGRNSFSKQDAESWGLPIKEVVSIPVNTLDWIVNNYCNGVYPDFLDCDIEGLDYEVLKSCHFSNDGPKVICVEVREKDIYMFDKILKEKKYYRFCRIGENCIYVQNKYADLVSHLSSNLIS